MLNPNRIDEYESKYTYAEDVSTLAIVNRLSKLMGRKSTILNINKGDKIATPINVKKLHIFLTEKGITVNGINIRNIDAILVNSEENTDFELVYMNPHSNYHTKGYTESVKEQELF